MAKRYEREELRRFTYRKFRTARCRKTEKSGWDHFKTCIIERFELNPICPRSDALVRVAKFWFGLSRSLIKFVILIIELLVKGL